MENTDILSARIRWATIATGIASALALFPILFLLYPAFLIAGGLIQPRFPTMGKWFVWAGAANLWPVVIVYDAMMFPHPFRQVPMYAVLIFSATTILLIWCSAELVGDRVKRMRARSSMPPREPRPVSRGIWILAVALNLLLGWEAVGWMQGSVQVRSVYQSSANFYSLLAMSSVQALTIVAFDVFVVRSVVELRRARRLPTP